MSTLDKFEAILELYDPVQKLAAASVDVMQSPELKGLLDKGVENLKF